MTVHVPNVLEQICPMHVVVSSKGHIENVGPTLQKLRPDIDFCGQRFLEVFDVQRPRGVQRFGELVERATRQIKLTLRDHPRTSMKGMICLDGANSRVIINLSFGLSVLDALDVYDLTNNDFAPTDLTVEMLYLIEAKSAAMDATRKLNHRLKIAMSVVQEQAGTDSLTGLKNRRGVDALINGLLAADQPFAVMHLDLDYFKAVNDTYGHAAGDTVLQKVSEILLEETGPSDTCIRWGGDEFVIVLAGAANSIDIHELAVRIITRIEASGAYSDLKAKVSASAGSVIVQQSETRVASDLIQAADTALYVAKRAGRGRHVIFEQEMAA